MPEFTNISVETTIDVEFEVFCGTCGAGLCSVSDTRKSNRGYLQVAVEACPDCMEEKNKEIEELNEYIKQLESKIPE